MNFLGWRGSVVVQVALKLARRLPHCTALEILDRAIEAQDDRDLDFEFEPEELEPPHPFAELIRQAFSPSLDPDELRTNLQSNSYNSMKVLWREALMRFADRYGIWDSAE